LAEYKRTITKDEVHF